MSKRKTALTIAIEWVEKEKKNISNRNIVSENWTADDQIQLIGDMLKGLLETERQDIIDAHADGGKKMLSIEINPAEWKADMLAADYFTSKYESNG